MNKLKPWIISLRLRTLALSFSAMLMGSIVAYRTGCFRWEILILSAITTLLLQILANISNDYGDAVLGADNENRVGPTRMIQSGVISLKEMKIAIIICTLLSFVSGVVLVLVSFKDISLGAFVFIFLGITAIVSAICYTIGRKPYGYRGFGDIFVFIFFGFFGVAGTYFLHGLKWDWAILLPASTIGFFSTAVLNLNNIRDLETDKVCGKNTLVVKIGRYPALWYNFFLILLAWISFWIFTYISENKHLLPFLTLPLFMMIVWAVFTKNNPERINSELRNVSLATLLFVILNIL
ncbi:MAG: 1,4-dihydroxy-2-naphthoate octaprenyltransferase [Marinilabiliaceae bacterium]|nr:1,4-dihydroxy-2-naphthoate octaprenyltransferase [Marinilabiliaceae bacterium]